jgi:predicted PurR-regulated permease PerM
MLLILAGVIGGLLAFGLLGIFVGPTVLAVAYTLLNAWIDEDETMEVDARVGNGAVCGWG